MINATPVRTRYRVLVATLFRVAKRSMLYGFLLWMQWPGQPASGQEQVAYYPREKNTLSYEFFAPLKDTTAINKLASCAESMIDQNRDSAVLLYKAVLRASEYAGYAKGMMVASGELAGIYGLEGKEPESVGYYYRAIHIAENSGALYLSELGKLYNNLAGTFNRTGSQVKALYYLEKSKALAERTGNYKLKGSVLINIGNTYVSREETDKARQYFLEAMQLGEQHQLTKTRFQALLSLGSVYLSQNKVNDALRCLSLGMSLKGDFPNMERYLDYTNFLMGKAHYQLQNYELAEHYLLATLNGAGNDYTRMIGTHEMLTSVYAATRRFEKALEHQKIYTALKDSLQGRGIIKDINRLETQYQSEKKDKEIAQQKLLNNRKASKLKQKNLWIWGISLCSTLLAVLSVMLLTAFRRRKRLQEKEIQLMQQQQKIEQLNVIMQSEEKERNRIGRDLHDGIGGMIAAINMNLKTAIKRNRGITDMKDFEAVETMLQSTANEVRKTAHNLMPEVLKEHNLEEALYLYTEQINNAGIIVIELYCHDITGTLDKGLTLTLYRMIQELVQNILKHSEAKRAAIQIRHLDGLLSISVEDDGVGFNSNHNHNGLGLKNLISRVEALQGYMFIDSSTETGTAIHIEFDLSKLKPSGL